MDNVRICKVKRNPALNEYRVTVYVNGKLDESATYYTDSKEDAIGTRQAIIDHYKGQPNTIVTY